ncbi:hypothetical protein SLEP1_g5809 [Rubroshorea leprosula]|uniref:Subtilisin-like protease fibronectin type-III domain-containing protein n=1 Tax=Rubroshorea leprosula TaxID=152421 RepID=A0AAV5HYZ5_9ROSI|nr:hypothetical protein SLEP1_g5809 [Rubroshorea leprosula]
MGESSLHSEFTPAASDCLRYSYQRSFNGFVANSTEDEADILAETEDVVTSIMYFSAFPMNPKDIDDNEFSYGGGYINPAKAISWTVNVTKCSKATSGTVWDLNYPSFTVSTTQLGESVTRVFHRTVRNVGSAVLTYKAVVTALEGLEIDVKPSVLSSLLGKRNPSW